MDQTQHPYVSQGTKANIQDGALSKCEQWLLLLFGRSPQIAPPSLTLFPGAPQSPFSQGFLPDLFHR